MEGVKSFAESFKEFIWDIVGYFVPGLYLLIILSICIDANYFYQSKFLSLSDKEVSLGIYFIAYILGYVIYGLSEIKEKWLGDRSYTKKKEAEVKGRDTYANAVSIMETRLLPLINRQVNLRSVREARNLAMSTAPEADQKVYTFMFRSELSRHIANVSAIIAVTGLLSSLMHIWFTFPPAIKTDAHTVTLYILLLLSYFFLRETRNRFYAIAIGLPFSIFLSKQLSHASQA
ncbi:hypothetical protein [Rubrolithibacter danxiaensis]|uniref:hypothetical protein n=1 Tax=Rubrolithibacter danxiaensis TaxID=3390805 RepID=UPI003BF88D79